MPATTAPTIPLTIHTAATNPVLTDNIAEAFGAAWLRLWALVADPIATEAQWEAGRTPVPREDTTERMTGLVNDPTFGILVDPRRRRLRKQMTASAQALNDALTTMIVQTARLEQALAELEDEDA